MFDLAEPGSMAPALSLRDAEDPQPRHRPRLLAFVRAWSMIDDPAEIARVRAALAQLDAELVVVCDEGAWAVRGDVEPVFCDRLAGDVATARAAYGVAADAIFVIDQRGIVRFSHHPDLPLSASPSEALDAAAEAMQWREHQTQLERVQWTAREWALKCLVVGCSLTFLPGPTAVEHRRFARGTGPVRLCESRDVITPRAEPGASSPQFARIAESPSTSSPRRPA